MPRILHSPLALTTNGEVLLNLTQLDLPRSPQALLHAALEQRAMLFVGVLLTLREQDRVLHDIAMIVPNVTQPLVALRQRERETVRGLIKKPR